MRKDLNSYEMIKDKDQQSDSSLPGTNAQAPIQQQHDFSNRSISPLLPTRQKPKFSRSDSGADQDTTQSAYNSKVRDCLRQFRLQILSIPLRPLSSWKSKTERRKVAMYQSRPMAVLHSLIHLLPLAGAVTLLVLFWSKYWIGPVFEGTTALQFVAKLHELLMQASIADAGLCIIRTLAVDGYVPLGALSGAAQATQLSYLWSLDFWATIRARGFYGWHKILFILSFALLLPLTALVGPSAAVLMIPHPNIPYRNATKTRYISDSIFPSTSTEVIPKGREYGLIFDESTFANLDAFSGWNKLSKNSTYNSFIYQYPEPTLEVFPSTRRQLYIVHADPPVRAHISQGDRSLDIYPDPYFATIPTQLSALTLCDFASLPGCSLVRGSGLNYNSIPVWSVQMPQPVVQVRCRSDARDAGPVPYVRDDGSDGYLFERKELIDRLWAVNGFKSTGNVTEINFDFSSPIWLRSPESGSSSLIGIFITSVDISRNVTLTHTKLGNDAFIMICNIQSYWKSAVASLAFKDSEKPIAQTDLLQSERWNATIHEGVSPISLHLAEDSHLRTVEFYRSIIQNNPLSLMLACIFVAAISNIPDIADLNKSAPDKPVPYKYIETLSGYGYGTSSTPDLLSVAVIMIYCIITIGYIIYTIATGSTSTAWNSPIEVIALALQSKKPVHLGHTSVGIDSIETFRESVGIRVNEQDKVELVFAHDRDIGARGLRKIERNRAY